MTIKALEIINNAMTTLGIAYGFGEYVGDPVVYPYYVGEYTETEPFTEDGLHESTFILTGFSRGSWLVLEETKAAIENYFNKVSGKIVMVDNGSAVAIFYANSMIVPTGDAELKSIQINLHVKEWSVS